MNSQIVKLTVWERMTLLDMVGQQRGDARTLRKALTLIDLLELTNAEKEQVKFVRLGENQFTWEDREYATDIEFKDGNAYTFLKELLKTNQFSVSLARPALTMLDKFGIND